tara:strand:+ start:139 stop:579 length:441 start_codon:yes stop_codon:yes gene_type:complete
MFYFNPNIFPDVPEAEEYFDIYTKVDKEQFFKVMEKIGPMEFSIDVKRTTLTKISPNKTRFMYVDKSRSLTLTDDAETGTDSRMSPLIPTRYLRQDLRFGLLKIKGDMTVQFIEDNNVNSPCMIQKYDGKKHEAIILIAPFVQGSL